MFDITQIEKYMDSKELGTAIVGQGGDIVKGLLVANPQITVKGGWVQGKRKAGMFKTLGAGYTEVQSLVGIGQQFLRQTGFGDLVSVGGGLRKTAVDIVSTYQEFSGETGIGISFGLLLPGFTKKRSSYTKEVARSLNEYIFPTLGKAVAGEGLTGVLIDPPKDWNPSQDQDLGASDNSRALLGVRIGQFIGGTKRLFLLDGYNMELSKEMNEAGQPYYGLLTVSLVPWKLLDIRDIQAMFGE